MAELPGVSVCVVTHHGRQHSFDKLLRYLAPAMLVYEGACELVVVNNSGAARGESVDACATRWFEAQTIPFRVVHSDHNNIAVGRNLALVHARFATIAFIDDDEYPRPDWLVALVRCSACYPGAAIAAPIIAHFDDKAPFWVKTLDVHNARGLSTGDVVPYAATGNFLLDFSLVGDNRFDPSYGRSGGSDTDFFLRIGRMGVPIVWCTDAAVAEDIPLERSTSSATIHRLMKQGANYRRIMVANGLESHGIGTTVRALAVAGGSLLIGLCLLAMRSKRCGHWLKRACANAGKVYAVRRELYGDSRS